MRGLDRLGIVLALLIAAFSMVRWGAEFFLTGLPCVRLEAKVQLAEEFCGGMARKYADSQCDMLGDDEAKAECGRIFLVSYTEVCLQTIDIDHIKEDFEHACG